MLSPKPVQSVIMARVSSASRDCSAIFHNLIHRIVEIHGLLTYKLPDFCCVSLFAATKSVRIKGSESTHMPAKVKERPAPAARTDTAPHVSGNGAEPLS